MFPKFQVLQGDATDLAFLKSERVGRARTFIALAGQDERNLMSSLVAQELGVPRVVALVERTETVRLWKRLGLMDVVSPRALAYERIQDYIESGYSPTIVSLQEGALVLERRLAPASPAAGVTLAEMNPPRGLIVGTVVRGDKVFVPRGKDRLEVGDLVILFVRQEELDTVRLLFPGRERDS
jgi:trk system potassium uptake protein TrkA